MQHFNGWNHFGFSYKHTSALTTTRQIFLLDADSTNAPQSSEHPRDCAITGINLIFEALAGGAANVNVSLWRDAAGDICFLGTQTVTITTGTGTATDGGCHLSFDNGLDHHFVTGLSTEHSSSTDPTKCNFYIGLSLDAGTANCRVVESWRY